MHLPDLVSDLAVILLTGGVITVIFKKLNLPLVLGYILAGFLIGPYMPLFFSLADIEAVSTWSEIGIIILMFCLGLEFNLHKLASVGGTAIITALVEVGGMLAMGFAVGQLMGWGTMDSIFLGGMLSMSSTTIIIKAFDELNVRKTDFAQLVFGTLVMEDIAGIFMMIILSTISVSKSISGGALALQLGLLVLYLVLWLVLGIFLLPTLLNKASKLMSDETLLIVSLGICFGMVLLADALGFSSALGAFLAGSLLAGTVHAERVEHLTSGVKDLFGAVFFISVGMMLDPGAVVKYIWPILILTVVTIVGKLLFSSLGVLLSGHTLRQAIYCGCSLAQIGEFAFIIASLGLSLGVIADYIYPIIISVSVITTLTTPFFIKSADRICTGLERLLPQKLVQQLERYTDEEQSVKEQDSDWAVFLRRYVKRTVFYGVLMLGIVILGDAVLLPLLRETIHVPWISKAITLCAVYLCIAMFIRPMLDAHSPQYTVLWAKKRSFRLPLIALSVIRVLVIVLIVFLPIRTVLGIHSLWLLPLLAAAVLVAGHFGWFASAYLSVETRFLTNFNERLLQQYGDSDDATWLDEKLYVTELICPSEEAGKDLRTLGWGRRYGVNIIKIVHGRRKLDIPSGDTVLSEGDRLAVLGERENLVSLRLSVGAGGAGAAPPPCLISGEEGPDTFTVGVAKNDQLAGCSIRHSGLRENYDCMILGLQRNLLPIIGPDVNFVIQRGDLVWLLGSRRMAEKALDDMEEA
mgnify:CR=1 FL=1